MNPLALDLFAGKHGWGNGLVAAGWDVISVDVEDWGRCPGFFMKADVRDIHGPMLDKTNGRKISLVVASPPCQEFSYRHLPFGRVKNLPPPDVSTWRACERIAEECNAPLVLENVIGAQKFMGKAKARYGSYYLWGDVPALLPVGNPRKGFGHDFQGRTKYKRIGGSAYVGDGHSKKGKAQRKEWSANAAFIPFELARWIGQCFNRSED